MDHCSQLSSVLLVFKLIKNIVVLIINRHTLLKNGNQVNNHQILHKITGRATTQIVIITQTNFHFLRIIYKSILM